MNAVMARISKEKCRPSTLHPALGAEASRPDVGRSAISLRVDMKEQEVRSSIPRHASSTYSPRTSSSGTSCVWISFPSLSSAS